MLELIRIETLLIGSILKKNSYKHLCPINVRVYILKKCITPKRPHLRAVYAASYQNKEGRLPPFGAKDIVYSFSLNGRRRNFHPSH